MWYSYHLTNSYKRLASMGIFERDSLYVLGNVHLEIQTVFMETNKQDILSVTTSVAYQSIVVPYQSLRYFGNCTFKETDQTDATLDRCISSA
jgi:hypothetical protein